MSLSAVSVWAATAYAKPMPRTANNGSDELIRLVDGWRSSRVLVVGGNSGMSMYDGQEEYGGGVPIACAELWTEGVGWELLDGCSDGDAAGSLPSQVWWPTLASDPVYGVLVVVGLDNRTLSTDGVTYFAASPEM